MLQKKKKLEVYINPVQNRILQAKQKTKAVVMGRGGGKTVNIGDHLRKFYREMPRSKGFFLNKTFGQAYTKTLPEILDRLRELGLKEHYGPKEPGHYVVCKTPPSWFAKPFKIPRKFDNTVTFLNGLTMDLLSFDRPDLARGGSYDWGIIDEAALIDFDTFKKTVRPLLRGRVRKDDHPMRFTLIIYTSRAWKSSGKWIEQDMKKLAAEFPMDYFYVEASAEDNLPVLGKEYFERMKREMDPITYAVEILNQPITKLPNCYYNFLDEERHLYEPQYAYDYTDENYRIREEIDVDPTLPLEPSFDFNGNFLSCTIWQDLRPLENKLRCLRNMFITHPSPDDLVDMVCEHYAKHFEGQPIKAVRIFGGKDGHTRLKLFNDFTMYERIASRFQHHGWVTEVCADPGYSDVAHKVKHLVINAALRGNNPDLPAIEINESHAKETFMSMMMSPIKGDFQKDKSSEADVSLQQQYATHLSDTVDNYIYPKLLKSVTEPGSEGSDFGVFSA